MIRTGIYFILLAGANSTSSSGECSLNPDGTSTCADSDQASLIQSKVRVHAFDADSSKSRAQHAYGPVRMPTNMLKYFKFWAQGKIDSHLDRVIPPEDLSENDLESPGSEELAMLDTENGAITVAEASDLFEAKVLQDCPDKAVELVGKTDFAVLHATPMDNKGIRHVLLRGKNSQLQYMSTYRSSGGDNEILIANPLVCSAVSPTMFLEGQDDLSGDDSSEEEKNEGTGESHMLTLDDPLVEDCKALFIRTVAEN